MVRELLINLEKVFATSPILGLGVSFLAGFLVSFSPCIYPLIPITLGIVGVATSSSKVKGFLISFIFVLGISTVYTTLGIVSSLLGVLLGDLFINSITYLILAVVFMILGACHFGIIKIKIPFFTPNYQPNNKGLLSIYILGMVSGLAVIPCNFPVLGTILSLISVKANIIYGALALFLFSLGYGVILIVLGLFTGLIRKLPKQGLWLIIVNKLFSSVLIIIGIIFLIRFIVLIR